MEVWRIVFSSYPWSSFQYMTGTDAHRRPDVTTVVIEALAAGRVLVIDYADRRGGTTSRAVEPMGYLGGSDYWYLLAWCRLRDAMRAFRLDRIVSAALTDEAVTPRRINPSDVDIIQLATTGSAAEESPEDEVIAPVPPVRGHLSLVPPPPEPGTR
jgi:predicted DNA-binding transcriptional regulator YafY